MKNKIIIFLVLASFNGFGQGIYRTLPNVTNTADSMKPVSTVQKAAIVQKLHTAASISALQGFTDATVAQFDGSTWNKVSGNVASNGGTFAGTIINVNASFYWQRKLTGFVKPDFFGAKLDGSTVDYAAIQLANSLNLPLLFENGTTIINSDIVFNKAVIVRNAVIKSTNNITFNGFEGDFKQCLDISGNILFKNVEKINAVWFGADGNSRGNGVSTTSGSNSITTQQLNTFVTGDIVNIVGAGVAGALLTTTITSTAQNVLTLATACSTTKVLAAIYTTDNSVALNRFTKALQLASNAYSSNTGSDNGSCVGYIPRGVYVCLSKVNIYSGVKIIGDYSNVVGGTILLQTNLSNPLISMVAANFNLNNQLIGGNGNNIFKDISFKSAFINDNYTGDNPIIAPIIVFQPAMNNHSDTEFDHCLWQTTAGNCIEAGFKTSGTGTSGTNTLTLGDGSFLRSTGSNDTGTKLIIKGAGASGADLSTYIVSGGGTNSVVLATNILTTVSSAIVYPTIEAFDPLKITNCELDVCRGGFVFSNNITGKIIIDNLEAFIVIGGVLNITTSGTFSAKISNSIFDGVGDSFNPVQAKKYAIYAQNGGTKTGDLQVHNVEFRNNNGYGSGIRCYNLSNVFVKDCYFENTDNNDTAKNLFLVENDLVIVENNIFKSSVLNNYTGSRLIAVSNGTAYSHISVSNNTFVNKNASSVGLFIDSDYPTNNDKFLNNTFKGNATSIVGSNIKDISIRNRYTEDNIVKYATTYPTAGTWVKGDRIVNNNPVVGQPKSWICTVTGTSGTWVSEGNL